MDAPSNDPENQAQGGTLPARGASRRRLLRGGAAAAPVVLTLASNPVMATTSCTAASAFASLNASRPAGSTTCGGKPPSYWATCLPSSYPSNCAPTTRWVDCGFTTCSLFSNTLTLRQICAFPDTSGDKCVAAHMAAAYINAKGGYVPGEVLGSGLVTTMWNNYYPLKYVVPTAGVKWFDVTPTVVYGASYGGVVGYIRSTMA